LTLRSIAGLLHPGNTKGEVSLYHWPPVRLVWNQLYANWQFMFLFAKETNPNQSNRRSTVHWLRARPHFLLLRACNSLSLWPMNRVRTPSSPVRERD